MTASNDFEIIKKISDSEMKILDKITDLAKEKGMKGIILPSSRDGKRFVFIRESDGKRIHFGSNSRETFIDLKDIDRSKAEKKRDDYRARHEKIKLGDGSLAYLNENSGSFYSYNLLW